MNAWLRDRPASAAGALAALVGTIALALWTVDARWALGPTGERPLIQPLCALGVLLGGLAAIALDTRSRSWRLAGRVLGGLLALLGLVVLYQYVSGRDPGIDRALFFAQVEEYAAPHPGRSSPWVASSFLLLGVALLAIDARHRWAPQVVDSLALIAGAAPYVALAGYAASGPGLDRAGPATAMALPTAIALASLVAATLALRPDRGLAARLLAPDLGALALRRLLPGALLVPLGVAFLRVLGERVGFYQEHGGIVLMTVAIAAASAGILIPLGRTLTRIDSDLKRQAEVIRLNASRWRTFLETTQDVVFIKNRDGRYLVANPAAARSLGHRPEELVGRTDADLFPSETAQRLRSNDLEVIRSGQTMTFEDDLVMANGKRRALLASLAPYRVDGRVEGLVGIVHDITERKVAESELKASESRFKQLAESIPQLVWIAGPGGGRDYVNEKWLSYTGLSVEESLGFSWQIAVHPDDRDRLIAQRDAARASGEPYEVEYRLRRHDGEYRWHLARGLPIRDDRGGIIRCFGTQTDIHDRMLAEEALRASEARFRALLEAAPDGVFLVDMDGLIQMVNQQAEQVFGYSREELLGRPVEILVPESLREAHRAHRAGYLAAPSVRRIDTRLDLHGRHKDGTAFDAEISLSPIATEKGLLIMAIVRDVTQSKRLLAELARHEAELQASREAARLKDVFLSTLSHEIKTPLSLILGYTELLQDKYPNEPIADGILGGAERLTQHVDDLLTYSALVGGSLTLFKTEVCLPEIVESGVAETMPEIREKGQDLAVYVDPDIPALEGDSRRLGQVVTALLANASRFTQPGGHIDVRVRAARDAVELMVSDDGPGMTAEQLERVWEPFGQAGTSLGERTGGLGLGLKIARRLTELHGGTMAVLSGPGRGTQVTVSLPAAAPAPGSERPAAQATQARRPSGDIRGAD